MSIVDFGDTRVREVMTPRTDIVWIDVAASLTVLYDLFVESKYSRIPVVRGSIDTVVGIVHVKDFFQAMRSGDQPLDRRPDARGVLRPGHEEGLGAAARVPAAAPLDGDRRGRVRRRLGHRHGRGPPRGDRRRDLRRARGRARAGLARRRAGVLDLRQGQHRRHPRPLRARARGGGIHDRRRIPGLASRAHPQARRDRTASPSCASPSRRPTSGGSTGSRSSRRASSQLTAHSSQPKSESPTTS